jgi:hypothetical protein
VTPKIRCDLIDLDPASDITVGELRSGHLRVAVAVPPDADLTEGDLEIVLEGWLVRTGGVGPSLSCTTRLVVVDSSAPSLPVADSIERGESGRHTAGPARVALLWTTDEVEQGWTSATVGSIERIPASVLAAVDSEYASLAEAEGEIPVLKLNETYSPLRLYTALRSREVGDEGVARAKDRYALGVGVEMFILEQHAARMREAGEAPPEEWMRTSATAAARGVLAVLPDFDLLVAEAGLEDL